MSRRTFPEIADVAQALISKALQRSRWDADVNVEDETDLPVPRGKGEGDKQRVGCQVNQSQTPTKHRPKSVKQGKGRWAPSKTVWHLVACWKQKTASVLCGQVCWDWLLSTERLTVMLLRRRVREAT